MKKLLIIAVISSCLFSCATKDQVVYFNNVKSLNGQRNLLEYEPKIEKNDVLRINVSSSSINPEIVAPFQMNQQGGQSSGGGGQSQSLTGYLVSPKGTINFPVLGTIDVEGLTRTEIQQDLETKIADYVIDPVVDVRIVNFSITVLGEVGNPGRVQINDGRVTMPELLAMSGDINYTGKRQNIRIIRESNGVKSVGFINMTETDLFSSPYYYLKQNDIVYVEPTYARMKSAGFFGNPGAIIGLISSIIGLVFIFTR
ncbi:polysaccharide biosynthesis/export family protein [Christiangramia sp. OXR-203]|jgi:polysaccharide export outer membrane protein|uniref:polysaccharide biosynthesis/export family protein n=1 Tax=Christiangramia sp. OXR-203 TaxID=3100176 RepID=UPI002AC970E7|nr:polysaccharide biosynthesis/export family protein [Christiangramia sp. OXR-203]WPY99738.1 polysaccharide biosynthesis/export family protein [Christiangramia sp. OXR-203]